MDDPDKPKGERSPAGLPSSAEANPADQPFTLPPFVLKHPRQAGHELRAFLKDLILRGALPAGAILSQLQLARTLGVSRTPVREALRMLHEDRLVEARTNFRAVVLAPDPTDLDALYAERVLLEPLAFALTVEAGGAEIGTAIEDSLARLLRAKRASDDKSDWMNRHRELHMALVAGAPEPLRRTIRLRIEQSERYQLVAIRQQAVRGDVDEHKEIVACFRDGRASSGAKALARHLGRTAAALMEMLAPGRVPEATLRAVAMLDARASPEIACSKAAAR